MIRARSKSIPTGRPSATRSRTPDTPPQTTWRALVRVTGLMRRLSEPHFSRLGLSGAQWGVLRSLARLEQRGLPEPKMHELGAELLVQPPSLSATLDRMVRAGLVTRREDAQDHRLRRVTMTAEGRSRLERALVDHRVWVEQMTVALTPVEQERLAVLLQKLSDHLVGMVDEPASGAFGRAARRPRRSS